MKTLTVRLPDELAKAIEAESRAAGASRPDVVRRRLEARVIVKFQIQFLTPTGGRT